MSDKARLFDAGSQGVKFLFQASHRASGPEKKLYKKKITNWSKYEYSRYDLVFQWNLLNFNIQIKII